MTEPILVTGGTGYIGSHLIQQLLAAGHRVRATVRSKSSPKNDFLMKFENAAKNLELVEADLTKDAGWAESCRGCKVVHHVASPFFMVVKNVERDLLRPAIEGTKRVLGAAAENGVKRVVLTSSMAAIGALPRPGKPYTEDDWNEVVTAKKLPYYYSKVMAEKAAWELQKNLPEEKRFDLVVINPGAVIGPSYNSVLGESSKPLVDLSKPMKTPFLVRMGFFLVDVRDVAAAHIAAQTTKNVNKRYVCIAETWSLGGICEYLRPKFPGCRFPQESSCFPPALLRATGLLIPGSMGVLMRKLPGYLVEADNSRIKDAAGGLGVSFRPLGITLEDAWADFVARGHVKEKK